MELSIGIDEALGIRQRRRREGEGRDVFLCLECGEKLRAHRAGGSIVAHFEHHRRNEQCSFSSSPNPADTGPGMVFYDLDDTRAREGYEIDRNLTYHGRNARIVEECTSVTIMHAAHAPFAYPPYAILMRGTQSRSS